MDKLDTDLEIREDKASGMFAIKEVGADETLVAFHSESNAKLVMSDMLVNPSTLLHAKIFNRIATAIYDLCDEIKNK